MKRMLQHFLADKRGLARIEQIMIAALFCAGTIVLFEALGHSLFDMLANLGHQSRL